MGKNTAWISFQDFIQRFSFDILKPEEFPDACAYREDCEDVVEEADGNRLCVL